MLFVSLSYIDGTDANVLQHSFLQSVALSNGFIANLLLSVGGCALSEQSDGNQYMLTAELCGLVVASHEDIILSQTSLKGGLLLALTCRYVWSLS